MKKFDFCLGLIAGMGIIVIGYCFWLILLAKLN